MKFSLTYTLEASGEQKLFREFNTFEEAQTAQKSVLDSIGQLYDIRTNRTHDNTPLTVKRLIEFLQTQNPDFLVAYQIYSEQALLTLDAIQVKNLCHPRPDGWVQNERRDMNNTPYLLFPGN